MHTEQQAEQHYTTEHKESTWHKNNQTEHQGVSVSCTENAITYII